MKKLVAAVAMTFCMVTSSMAEDKLALVFENIDDLVTRVETGISLNSYAETLASIKIDLKRALINPDRPQNLLADERLAGLMAILDDYTKVWRVQETDNYMLLPLNNEIPGKYSNFGDCCRTVKKYRSGYEVSDVKGYEISCIKEKILGDLKPIIEESKSAHFNGW